MNVVSSYDMVQVLVTMALPVSLSNRILALQHAKETDGGHTQETIKQLQASYVDWKMVSAPYSQGPLYSQGLL